MLTESTKEKNRSLVIIDYGYASRFQEKNGTHIKQHEIDQFKGNLMFAPIDQIEFRSASRKSDLISIFYILIFMLNDFELPFAPIEEEGISVPKMFL